MSLKERIIGKLNAIEEDLKIISELLIEVQAEKKFIEYLLHSSEEDCKNGE